MEKMLSTFVIPTVEEYLDEPLIIERSDGIHRRNKCVFCRIAHGEDPNTELLYKVSLFIILSISPLVTHVSYHSSN